MQLDECIAKRRSVRKFLRNPISVDYLAELIKAGSLAPSAGNLQDVRFVVVTDETQKEKIADICAEQVWMACAGAIVVVCTDNRDIERFYGERGKNVYSVQDAAAAAENMFLKAYDIGLGACWVGAFDIDKMKEELALPEFVTPQLVLVVGYPAEHAAEKQKFKIEELVHMNQYGKKSAEYPELGELIKRLVEKGKKALDKQILKGRFK